MNVVFNLSSAGTWVLSNSLTPKTSSYVVENIEYDATLSNVPDGKTVLPTDDIQTWLNCADIWDKEYTTLVEVLADKDTLVALMARDNAIDYMVRSTDWATRHALVPTMTSDTTPSGECFAAQSLKSGYPAYYAFDNNTSTDARSASDLLTHDIAYDFITPVNISKMVYNVAYYVTIKYQYSDDKILWEDGSSTISLSSVIEQQGTVIGNTLNTSGTHRYWRFYGTQSNAGVGAIRKIQFYSTAIPLVETAMQYIGASDYASTTLLADSTWREAIINSEYIDDIFNVTVPTMTSNTTPEGTCIRRSTDGSNEAYQAFDKNASTPYVSASSVANEYVGYIFPKAIEIIACKTVLGSNTTTSMNRSIKVQGSTDAFSTAVDLSDLYEYTVVSPNKITKVFDLYNVDNYTGYRLLRTDANQRFWVDELQFYGRENGGVQSWLKVANIKKNYYLLSQVLADTATLSTLMASEDAVDYLVTVKSWISAITSNESAMTAIGNSNYASNTLLADSDWRTSILNSIYRESVLNVTVPTMISNTNPEGECFYTFINYPSNPPYYAFDGDVNTKAINNGTTTRRYCRIGYKFTEAVKLVGFMYQANQDGTMLPPTELSLEASNDNSTYYRLSPVIYPTVDRNEHYVVLSDYVDEYLYYSLYCYDRLSNNSYYYTQFAAIQFYGRKDV